VRYEDEYFLSNNSNDLWQRYCGFLSLSLDEFSHIQQGLIKEQIKFLAGGGLHEKLMPRMDISSLDEFRQAVPLRRYDFYSSLLDESRENMLGEKPFYWVHTSAIRGTYKKVPWTTRFNAVQRRNVISSFILSSAEEAGDVRISLGSRVMHLLPGRPFASASIAYGLVEQFSIRPIPPMETQGSLTFNKRINRALTVGLRMNVDYVIAMTSSLVRMAQKFDQVWKQYKSNPANLVRLHPQVAWRLLSRKHGKTLMPADVWSIKGIVSWGADSDNYSDLIENQWGRRPVQMYGSSEGGLMAMQDWHKGPLCFIPDTNFFEFIPEEAINQENPRTVLIDEVEEGKAYELVITNFYGMPFARYRQGDLIRIVKGDSVNRDVPRMVFLGRADDTIDLFGISRINTGVINDALNNIGVKSENWCLHKCFESGRIFLDFFIESVPGISNDNLEQPLSRAIRTVDRHWGEAVITMAYNPVRVNIVPQGTFERFGVKNNGNTAYKFNPPDTFLKEIRRVRKIGS